jgi:hypothetical protein
MQKKKTISSIYSKKGYAVGERNGSAKLTNDEVVLMFDYRDSCMKELIEIELELEKLEARKIQLKNQMTRRYIADMFEISTAHCERIFRGEARKEIIKK